MAEGPEELLYVGEEEVVVRGFLEEDRREVADAEGRSTGRSTEKKGSSRIRRGAAPATAAARVRPPTVFSSKGGKSRPMAALLCSLPAAGCPPAYRRGRKRGGASSFRCGIAEPSGVPAPLGQKTQYKDGWFETAFMSLFARKMEKFAGGEGRSGKGMWDWNYESFVDVSRRVMMGRSRKRQQEVVREVLLSMLPPGAPAQFRKLFPPTKWAAEFNAALTVPFFHWLVGPSEVVEVEVNGVKQRSGVHIKKCRYLENSGCVGMCVNMCKIPTQDFFTNEFGLPLTMIPNFEDMSCDMVYGQVPPPFEEDPVSTQPCYANLCSVANQNSPMCPKLQN